MGFIRLYTLFVILLVVIACSDGNDHRHLRSVLSAFFDANIPQPANLPKSTCTGCSKRYQTDLTSDEDTNDPNEQNIIKEVDHNSITAREITALRIEYIKNQILTKLRLKEKPSSVAKLPQPVEDQGIVDANDVLQRQYSDDFYGKTTEAIIFPFEDEAKCVRKIRNPSACVPFQMPNDIAASDVSSVELWFYKEPDAMDAYNQTFIVSEIAHWDSNKSFQKNKPFDILQTDIDEGWIQVDVTSVIKYWLMYQDSPTHAIAIACKTCGMDMQKSPISFRPSFKPFLIIKTFLPPVTIPPVRRQKRSTHICSPGEKTCCRSELYLSFADIGWDDWIISPKGIHVYYCTGTCQTAAALTFHPTDLYSIQRKAMYGSLSRRNGTQKIELLPCCAPTHYSSLDVLYTDNHRTIMKKVIPKLIVEGCGCI